MRCWACGCFPLSGSESNRLKAKAAQRGENTRRRCKEGDEAWWEKPSWLRGLVAGFEQLHPQERRDGAVGWTKACSDGKK